MFLSVIMVLSCISMIESNSCDISKEKATISTMLQSIEKKMKEKCSVNSENCPAGWKQYKDHCYFLSSDTKTWHASDRQCKAMGGYLVTIKDSAENSWVVDMLTKSVKHKLGSWMGLADLTKTNDWRWVHDSSKAQYSNWGTNGPSNTYGNQPEDCASFWADAKYVWNDVACATNGIGYVCECSHGPDCRPFNG